MAHICLVSCVKSKKQSKVFARELYTSPFFRKASSVAMQCFDKWFILSAKYGIVHPDNLIEPYEQTLNTMPSRQREIWAKDAFSKLMGEVSKNDSITLLAGERYREKLAPLLAEAGFQIHIPLEGMSIGRQLQWLNAQIQNNKRLNDVDRFYRLIENLKRGLKGPRILKDCTGKLDWPKRGVYFFFENGEFRHSKPQVQRIVRVGTHAVSKGSRSTLWGRLRSHRGAEDGSGNHRGSIFRLHIGAALCAGSENCKFQSWGKGQNATREVKALEDPLERKVSEHIGLMPLLWLSIDDESGPASDRAFIEKNCIALLIGNKGPIDPPNSDWLGNWSRHPALRTSGLWNINYITHDYDDRVLDIFAEYVDITLEHRASPKHSIAPSDWFLADKNIITRGQIQLFKD